ncbi:hypothetical protein DRH27_03170 [Candidatus Falkowbacteria bacterium]|nr:MAG: hypothetical protein DRH27_03170 [Candidatus Falkowbacteria bacterium]
MQKSTFRKTKKSLKIKGSRFNLACKCGNKIRVRMNKSIIPERKKNKIIISVNKTVCSKCGLKIDAISKIEKDNCWEIEENFIPKAEYDFFDFPGSHRSLYSSIS